MSVYMLTKDVNKVLVKGTLFNFVGKDRIKVGDKLFKVSLNECDYVPFSEDNVNNQDKITQINDEINFVQSVLKVMAPPISHNCPAREWENKLKHLLEQKKILEKSLVA